MRIYGKIGFIGDNDFSTIALTKISLSPLKDNWVVYLDLNENKEYRTTEKALYSNKEWKIYNGVKHLKEKYFYDDSKTKVRKGKFDEYVGEFNSPIVKEEGDIIKFKDGRTINKNDYKNYLYCYKHQIIEKGEVLKDLYTLYKWY